VKADLVGTILLVKHCSDTAHRLFVQIYHELS
jgi:hypothetical protein